MTAHAARPSDRPDPMRARTLRALDPTELLAHVTLGLQEHPRDSLALVGHRDRRTVVVATRSELDPIAGDSAPAVLVHLLASLRTAGCTGAFGLVVLGDGYEPLAAVGGEPCGAGDEDFAPVGRGLQLATRVLIAAYAEDFDIPELWVVANGWAHGVCLAGPPGADVGIAVSRPVPLGDTGSTLVAAESVLAGEQSLRRRDAPIAPLRSLLQAGAGTSGSRSGPHPAIQEAWSTTRAVLRGLASPSAARDPERWMTACEQVRGFVTDLAAPGRRDEFLVLLLSRGQAPDAIVDADITPLVEDPTCHPHSSICAGGSWYEALRQLEAITRPPLRAPTDDTAADLRAGWANLATVLALAAWWNHRFATAGALTDEVLAASPGHSLARLVAVMATAPVHPGWDGRPST